MRREKIDPTVLRVVGLKKHFGGLKAIDGVDLEVRQGETLGIIGPNGAGKTTLFNTICGVYAPTEGKVILNGREVQALPPHVISRMGVARTFQIVRIFKDMSVLDNVLVAIGMHRFDNIWASSNAVLRCKMSPRLLPYWKPLVWPGFMKPKPAD